MATIRAVANGNWSATSTWNGGVVPGNGDTVYSNGWNVTINQDITIGGANNPLVNAGSFVSGQWYQITSIGTTSFPGAGSNTVGTVFLATGAGTGTGQASALATLTTATNTAAGATTGGGVFTMPAAYNVTADIVSGTTSCLTATHSAGTISITNSRVNGGPSSGAQGVVISGAGGVNFTTSTFTSGIGGGGISYAVNLSGSASVTISGGVLVSPINTGSVLANTSSAGNLSVSGVTTNLVWQAGIINTGAGTTSIGSSTLNAGANSNALAASNTSSGTLTISGSTINASSAAPGVSNSSTGTLNCSTCTFTAANGLNAVSSTNASANCRFSGIFVSSTNGTQAIYAPRWILNTTPLTSYIQHSLDGISPTSFVRFYTADNTGLGPTTNNVRSGVTYSGMTGSLAVPLPSQVAVGVPTDNTVGTAALTADNLRAALGLGSANLDSQLAVLSNLDTTVSSRLAPSGTLATVTTLTNSPNVPSAASIASQVRTELTSELSKVAALNTDRLAQCATTSIVGNLIAQSNS